MNGNKRAGMVLQERDRQLLRELATLRIADRSQVRAAAGFGSDSRTNRRLRTITRAGLLKRFFLGTNAAGQKALYSLSEKGALLVGVPHRGLQRRQGEALVADFFVSHQLAVNEVYCALKYGGKLPLEIKLLEWKSFYQPLVQGSRLIPDGYVSLGTPHAAINAFLEIDLGHERRAVWREKVQKYVQFASSGDYERVFREKRFRVLVLTTTERRLESLRSTIASITDKIFWLTTTEAFHKERFSCPIWLRPKGRDRQALVEGAPLP